MEENSKPKYTYIANSTTFEVDTMCVLKSQKLSNYVRHAGKSVGRVDTHHGSGGIHALSTVAGIGRKSLAHG